MQGKKQSKQVLEETHGHNINGISPCSINPLAQRIEGRTQSHSNSKLSLDQSESLLQIDSMGKISIELISMNSSISNGNGKTHIAHDLCDKIPNVQDGVTSIEGEKDANQVHFRKMQHKSLGLLLGIVLIFLVCNFPRFLVKAFIISNQTKGLMEHWIYCDSIKQLHVPAFVHIMGKF